jgi:glyoxylase-like metal-dependent hydrolase (beta-lactamase superfamily II)
MRNRRWHFWMMIFETCLMILSISVFAQNTVPDWCKDLPRPAYKSLERIKVSDPWFEVYEPAPGVFAIYEPHQWEETIGYLIVGNKRAMEFDTGMGISDIRKVIRELTQLPLTVLNSHTHPDHVGGNWEFDDVEGMNIEYTRTNAKGSKEFAQAEIGPGHICGALPPGFDAKAYSTRPWKIASFVHNGSRFDLGGRTIEVIETPGHAPDAICLIDRENGLLFTGDSYYPGTIYLTGAGTDLDAYEVTVHRLAKLAPELKTVLGAHNVPVASPHVLPKLAAAFDKVLAGKGSVSDAGSGYAVSKVDGFAFLMSGPKAK